MVGCNNELCMFCQAAKWSHSTPRFENQNFAESVVGSELIHYGCKSHYCLADANTDVAKRSAWAQLDHSMHPKQLLQPVDGVDCVIKRGLQHRWLTMTEWGGSRVLTVVWQRLPWVSTVGSMLCYRTADRLSFPRYYQMNPAKTELLWVGTKLAVIVHRCLHGRAPRYLADHLIPASDAAPRRRRLHSANLNRLTVPRCRLST